MIVKEKLRRCEEVWYFAKRGDRHHRRVSGVIVVAEEGNHNMSRKSALPLRWPVEHPTPRAVR